MSKALSNVQVSISGSLDPSFTGAFNAADKKQAELAQQSGELSKKIGDIASYRKQQNALKDAATSYMQAKQKVAALKAEIAASEAPTRKQAAALAKAEREATRAGAAYSQARTKLADMARELQRNGSNVSNLSTEYRRLKSELETTNAKYAKHEASLRRQQAAVSAMQTAWQGIGKFAAGAMAAGAVLSGPTKKALSYEEQLAYMADTAGVGKSPAEKQALQKSLSDSVEQARQFSKGASREDVASALTTLIASGKFEDGEAQKVLPSVSRAAFASGANPEDIAKTAVAMKQFGIRDISGGFDKMLRAGQLGNFELKDMARFLPQQLGLGKASGMTGDQALVDLLAFNQVAMKTAGTQDEAGNNVINLLQKLSSREFQKSISQNVKVQKGDPTTGGKKGGKTFDWSGYLIKQREQGVGAVDAFAMLMERQMGGDKRYQGLQAKIKTAGSDEERKQTLEAMADIASGSGIGQIIADRQALLGALASLYGRKEMGDLRTSINASGGAVGQSSEFIGQQNFAKAKLLSGNIDRANENTYDSVKGPMSALLDGVNGLTQEFPRLTTAAYGATAALTAVAAWGAGSTIFGKITGGGAAAGGAAAGGGIVGKMMGGSVLARTAGTALTAAAAPMAAVTLANSTSREEDEVIDRAAINERAHLERLKRQYGEDTLQKAYKKEAPWYQFGGYQNARPERLEEWVKRYVAGRPVSEAQKTPGSPPVLPVQGGPALPAKPVMPPAPGVPPRTPAAPMAASLAAAPHPAIPSPAAPLPPSPGPGGAKIHGSNNTAAIVTDAARAAAAAAVAAAPQPNVNQTFHNNFSVTVNEAKDGKGLSADLERELARINRSQAAAARAGFAGLPEH